MTTRYNNVHDIMAKVDRSTTFTVRKMKDKETEFDSNYGHDTCTWTLYNMLNNSEQNH